MLLVEQPPSFVSGLHGDYTLSTFLRKDCNLEGLGRLKPFVLHIFDGASRQLSSSVRGYPTRSMVVPLCAIFFAQTRAPFLMARLFAISPDDGRLCGHPGQGRGEEQRREQRLFASFQDVVLVRWGLHRGRTNEYLPLWSANYGRQSIRRPI